MPNRVFISLSLIALATAGCRNGGDTAIASGQPAAAPGAVVAQVDGQPITLADLDKVVDAELSDVRQQEYDIRRRALDQLISDRLIDKEAKARGISRDELLKAEVDGKLTLPSESDLNTIYEMNKHRFAGRTREMAMAMIKSSVERQARAEREHEYRSSLRQASPVKITLAAPRSPVTVPADAPSRGPRDAKVTMVEFLDYGCGYCKRAHGVVEEVLKKYEGKIRFVHRDYPLSPDGPTVNAARGVWCAGDQDKFWEYHADLMVNPGAFDTPELTRRASGLGLDGAKFTACVTSGKFDPTIDASAEDGRKLGVNSTPTFFINGRRVSGAQPLESFAAIIDEELASAG